MEHEKMWNDFQLSIDLHKFYVDFAVKLNLFYYAITGGILSFHFSHKDPHVTIIGLMLPVLLSILLGAFFVYSAKLAWNLRYNIRLRANQLNLVVFPEGIVLVLLCVISGVTMLSVGATLVWYLVCA